MRHYLLFALLLCVSMAARAADSCFEYQATYAERTTGWYLTKEKACSALNGGYAVGGNATSKVASNSKPNDFGGCNLDVTVTYEGGTVINGGGTGSLQSRQTDQCTPPPDPDQCSSKSGKSEIVNITAGWARDAGPTTPAQSWVYTYRLPSTGVANFCSSDGCQQSIDANEPCAECQAYTSQVPGANGLYRKSVDFRAHYSGTSCDPSKSDIDRDLTSANDQRDPPCPGYVGEVNGVKGCYGTADKPVRPTDPQMPNKPQDNGNPAAGPKPSSGEGSGTGGTGRTPSTGTGGSAGGPAGAAAGGTGSGGSGSGSGTRPDGTTNKPSDGKEQQACGAPGQPKCQIDETGTPKIEDGKYDKAADQYKTDRDALRDKASGTSDKGFFDGWRSFWFAPPIAACVPFALPSLLNVSLGNVDPCAVVEGVRSIMAYIWALAGLLLCVGMVTRTIRGGS
ncbi:hypothetical protein [Paracidovorax wautersii]|uniref:hypothetical protein n=1 Tax=Paracidovorax wautersii TaxID=1177982 RepID=UPI0031E25DA2